jgi:hypothetical protein
MNIKIDLRRSKVMFTRKKRRKGRIYNNERMSITLNKPTKL